ncbi:MAG: hypothetical protein CM15mP83_6500 [Flavobacteriaceae bacterium]|nr:MAG: hypothetical protein CM15mP83_6500 [Flavobacteriaceae bacterium]
MLVNTDIPAAPATHSPGYSETERPKLIFGLEGDLRLCSAMTPVNRGCFCSVKWFDDQIISKTLVIEQEQFPFSTQILLDTFYNTLKDIHFVLSFCNVSSD